VAVDILLPTFNRLEFTRETVTCLLANTEWDLVRNVVVLDDQSTDGTWEYLQSLSWPVPNVMRRDRIGGPVAAMIQYVGNGAASVFAKIDSDTIVPPLWLSECLSVMDAEPDLDLLGIEAFCPAYGGSRPRSAVRTPHIGGIGLMRSRAFRDTLPEADGRWGFTAWQEKNESVGRGWLNPALPVFLLDHLPMEPWASLSKEYVRQGWQREWPEYGPQHEHLWQWWLK